MKSFNEYVTRLVDLLNDGEALPLGDAAPLPAPTPAEDAPKVLIFSPHPDDEVIMGGLPLRLARECDWRVINVAVTQGSNLARQEERWEELENCCKHIGFELIQTIPGGFCNISEAAAREADTEWQKALDRIADILKTHRPRLILFPHLNDWNSTHIGTSSPKDVGDLITALSFHAGEVRRNPYHLTMPATMIDNVRRGSEVVGGQGKCGPKMQFATLLRHRRWNGTELEQVEVGDAFICIGDDPTERFPA